MATKPKRRRNQRVTIHDIAADVDLHFTTVARALKGSNRVSVETVKRVQRSARKLGYQADPMVSAFCSYRTSLMKRDYRGNLAWINGFSDKRVFEAGQGFYRDIYEGALQRCADLGFKLETCWLGEPGMTTKRASQVIHSRGVSGVLVAPLPPEIDELDMKWDRFCTVKIGYSSNMASVANVTADHYGNMQRLFDRLLASGFRRVGFVCDEWIDDRVSNRWSGAYLTKQAELTAVQSLSPYLGKGDASDKAGFRDWFSKNVPDVVIVGGGAKYVDLLSEYGLKIPRDAQVVSLNAESDASGFLTGIRQEGQVVGAVAVDQLSGIVDRSRIGVESFPRVTSVLGKWHEGRSYDPKLLKKPRD